MKNVLSSNSFVAYTTSMDKKYEALSDRQVAGLCYMLPMKLVDLAKKRSLFKGSLEKDKTLIDCVGVLRQAALRFPDLLGRGLEESSLVLIEDDIVLKHAQKLKEGETLKLSDIEKYVPSMADTMMAMSEVKSGARKLLRLECLSHISKKMPLPATRRQKFFNENFERMALPLEGMSCTEAAEQILADPKGYAQKEEAQPPRKRQNQYERFINGGRHARELTSCQTEVEKSAHHRSV